MRVDIVWLRDDFRLDDRPALYVYVHDESPRNGRSPGGAAKWRLAQSLKAMEKRLTERGARLDVLRGAADRTILAVAESAAADRLLWTRRYEGAAIALDAGTKASLRESGVEGLSLNGRLMREPWELAGAGGAPSATFSAFWRRHQAQGALAPPLPVPALFSPAPRPADAPQRIPIEALRLTPTAPDWSAELALGETPGEEGGLAALGRFVDEALPSYASARDQLGLDATARLSAHLRFGELSVRRVAAAVESAVAANPRLAPVVGDLEGAAFGVGQMAEGDRGNLPKAEAPRRERAPVAGENSTLVRRRVAAR
jgi:deoxyribodipyrimidine photo-lyase